MGNNQLKKIVTKQKNILVVEKPKLSEKTKGELYQIIFEGYLNVRKISFINQFLKGKSMKSQKKT